MSSTARFRQVGSAVCLAAFPLLLLVGESVGPWNVGDDTAETLRIAGANVSTTNLADILMFVAILASVPGFLALMRLTRDGAPVVSLSGGILAVSGYVAGMLQVIASQYNLTMSQGTDPAAMVTALENSPAWVLGPVLVTFLVGMLLGPILLGVAVWRSQAGPLWTGIALIVSSVTGLGSHIVMLRWVDQAGLVLMTAATVALALRITAIPVAQWEGATSTGKDATSGVSVPAV
jgi:hypothetical protein